LYRGYVDNLEFNLENIENLLNDLAGELSEKRDIDQAKITPDSIFKRINFMKEQNDLYGARLLCIGDFDLTGTLSSIFGNTKEVVVADIDERIAEILFEINFDYDKEIRFVYHDMRKKMIEILKNEFEIVITEPPPTIEGLELFLKRAIISVTPLRMDHNAIIYISIPHKKEFRKTLEQLVKDSNGEITHRLEKINKYIDGREETDFYRIIYNQNKIPLGNEHYLGPLYSMEVSMKSQPWQCKCGETIMVGENEKYKTLKELETKGCPKCRYKGPFRFQTKIEIK